MAIPNIWGQGQLFAFSALDGDSFAGDDFVGTLSADKIGIRFHTKVTRELAIVNIGGLDPRFRAVTSDIIMFDTSAGKMSVIYADTHTVIGNLVPPAVAVVMTEGIHTTENAGGTELHDTHDGEYTALVRAGDRFAFAYGKTREAAKVKAEKGLLLDAAQIAEKKLGLYQKFKLAQDNPYALLYGKCLSVMKSQLYSPEGAFRRIWSTPDRLPHKHLWLWDSVFHAIGHRNLDAQLAEDLILAVIDGQDPDGFIAHMASVSGHSGITQPPVIAWGAWLVYAYSHSKKFLERIFKANKQFLLWCRHNRRDTREALYTWLTKQDKNCRCDESGMDNSPRFDIHSRLQAIDFSCFMANDVRHMAKIAAELGYTEEEAFFTGWYQRIRVDINRKLWCEEDRFYYDYDLPNTRMHKVQSVASFLPLFAGICSREQAQQLVQHLTNPETFYTPLPVPSISRQDPTYGSDMWRGPVWINYNYMLILGLQDYGYTELSEEIQAKTIDAVNGWYHKTGTVFEFYDPENQVSPASLNRKGTPFEPYDFSVRYQSIRDYGWSNTLCFDLLHRKHGK